MHIDRKVIFMRNLTRQPLIVHTTERIAGNTGNAVATHRSSKENGPTFTETKNFTELHIVLQAQF